MKGYMYITIKPGVEKRVANGDLLEFCRHLDRDVRLPNVAVKVQVPPKPPSKKVKRAHHKCFNGVGKSIDYWERGHKKVKGD